MGWGGVRERRSQTCWLVRKKKTQEVLDVFLQPGRVHKKHKPPRKKVCTLRPLSPRECQQHSCRLQTKTVSGARWAVKPSGRKPRKTSARHALFARWGRTGFLLLRKQNERWDWKLCSKRGVCTSPRVDRKRKRRKKSCVFCSK